MNWIICPEFTWRLCLTFFWTGVAFDVLATFVNRDATISAVLYDQHFDARNPWPAIVLAALWIHVYAGTWPRGLR